jgi:hypothetical protein
MKNISPQRRKARKENRVIPAQAGMTVYRFFFADFAPLR